MQRVSSGMSCTIESMYNSNGNIRFYNINNIYANYSAHNVFPLFFRVSLQGNRIELPILAKRYVQSKLLDRLENTLDSTRREDIIMRFCTTSGSSYRTADALIREIVNFSSTNDCMYGTVNTNKGETYYGCNGTIFNKDMVLLIFNVIECEIVNNNLVYKRVKSYIHPSVFYSNGIVEKCIANKIIPFVMQNGIEVRPYDLRVIDNINYVAGGQKTIPKLSVTDITDKFFCRPILPSVTYSNDDVNNMLNRNIDDIFNIIGL